MAAPHPRPCAGCDVVDELPRHTFGLVGDVDRAAIPAPWHLACHAAAGCPSCTALLATAAGTTEKEIDHG